MYFCNLLDILISLYNNHPNKCNYNIDLTDQLASGISLISLSNHLSSNMYIFLFVCIKSFNCTSNAIFCYLFFLYLNGFICIISA